MKNLLILLLLTMAVTVSADSYFKFTIIHDKRMANEDKMKYCTRQIWSEPNNIRLPDNWSELTETQRTNWCYSGWATGVTNIPLASTNCDVYMVSQEQTENWASTNNVNSMKTYLLPELKINKDYIVELIED